MASVKLPTAHIGCCAVAQTVRLSGRVMSTKFGTAVLTPLIPSGLQPGRPARQEVARAGTELQAAIQQEVCRLGFDRFLFRRCRLGAYSVIDWVSSVGRIIEKWHEVYRQRGFGAVDPRFRVAASSSIPEVWYRAKYPDTREMRDLFDTVDALGVGSGVCLVVHRPDPSTVDFFQIATSNPYVDTVRKKQIALVLPKIWSLATHAYASGMAELLDQGAEESQSVLTERQTECLALAARGLPSRRIAEALGISERTVGAHIQACILRLNARNRGEAVANAVRAGLLNASGRVRPAIYRASTLGDRLRKHCTVVD